MEDSLIIEKFANDHNIRIADQFKGDELSILWLHSVKQCIDDSISAHCRQLFDANDSSWAMLLNMLDRVHEHAEASIVCYFTGSWASLEVVVRAVIEAAITVIYTTQEDRHARVGQYLTNYFALSRKAIDRSDPSRQDEARRHLEFRENIIRQVAANDGIPFEANGWPTKVIERFNAVGMENDYRHLYTVLSGQMHNDAESLIDFVIFKCLSRQDPRNSQLAGLEVLYWMRFYMYSGLRFYAVAANRFAEALELVGAITETRRVEMELISHIHFLMKEFHPLRQRTENESIESANPD
jgi:hypothetical protein